MLGDQKWPPAERKQQVEEESELEKKIAEGPAFRPKRPNKVSILKLYCIDFFPLVIQLFKVVQFIFKKNIYLIFFTGLYKIFRTTCTKFFLSRV